MVLLWIARTAKGSSGLGLALSIRTEPSRTMDQMPVGFGSSGAAVVACVLAAAAAFPCAVDAQAPAARHVASQQAPAKAEKDAPSAKGSQAIVVLVNDEPVTAYEIEQRANFLLANAQDAGGGDFKAKAEARWQQITKDPK